MTIYSRIIAQADVEGAFEVIEVIRKSENDPWMALATEANVIYLFDLSTGSLVHVGLYHWVNRPSI